MSRPEVAMSGLPLPEPVADEDDDGLQDRAALLTPARPRPGRRRPRPRPHAATGRCLPLVKTLTICLAFFSLGLCVALPGPTLLDLQDQVSVSLAQISQIFLWRALGYLAGSMLSGLLFDRLNRLLMMLISIALAAAGMATVPWLTNALSLNVCFTALGVPLGFVDTGGNVLLLDLWGKSSGPYMQAIHFSFGLGAFAAPLLAVPFISPAVAVNGSATALLGRNHLHTVLLPAAGGPDLSAITRPPTEPGTSPPPPQFARLAGGDAAVRVVRDTGPEGWKAAGAGRSGDGAGGAISVGSSGPATSGGDSIEVAARDGTATQTRGLSADSMSEAGRSVTMPTVPPYQAGNDNLSTDPMLIGDATVRPRTTVSKSAYDAAEGKVPRTGIPAHEDQVPPSSGEPDRPEEVQVAGQGAAEQAMYDAIPGATSAVPPQDGTATADTAGSSEPTSEAVAQHAPKPKPVFTDGNKLEHDQTWARPPLKPALHPAPAADPRPSASGAGDGAGVTPAANGNDTTAAATGASTGRAEGQPGGTVTGAEQEDQESEDKATGGTAPPVVRTTSDAPVVEQEVTGPSDSSPVVVTGMAGQAAGGAVDNTQTKTLPAQPDLASAPRPVSGSTATPDPSTVSDSELRPAATELSPANGDNTSTSSPAPSLPPASERPTGAEAALDTPHSRPPVQIPDDGAPVTGPDPGADTGVYEEGDEHSATAADGETASVPVAGTEPGLSVPAPAPTAALPATPPGTSDQHPSSGAEPAGVHGRPPSGSDVTEGVSASAPTGAAGSAADNHPDLSEAPAAPSPRPHKPGTYDDTSAEDGLLTRLSSAAAQRGVTPLAQLYLLASCCLLLVALIFLALLVYDPRARRAAPAADGAAGPSRCYTATLVTLMAVVLCFYVGMEVAMGQLLMSFSVHAQVHLTRAGGAYVTSVFWGLFATGRALSICVAGVLRPAAVLAIDYALVTAGAALLLAAGSWDRTALLLGGGLSGLGMASVFPAALVWLEQHIHVSSRLAAVLVVAGAAGEMLLPAGVGALMAHEPRALTYSLAGCVGVCLLTQAAAVLTARLGRPAVGPLEGYQLAAQEDDDDMVDLAKYPGSAEEGGRRLLRL